MQRILVLSHRDIRHHDGGGAPLYIHEIFKRLVKLYRITIVSTKERGLPTRERIDGLDIIRLPFPKLSRLTVPISVITRLLGRSDILIDNGSVGFPWLTPLYSQQPRIAIVYQVAAEIFNYELPRPLSDIAIKLEPWVYRGYRYSKIVTCSESTKSDLVRLGIPDHNIRVIRPGIGEAFLNFQPTGQKFATPTVVCLSRFRRYKGVRYAVRAMKWVLEEVPNANLLIVGNGDDSEIRDEIARTDLGYAIRIVKRSPHYWDNEKRTLLAAAHAVVVPSVREGYGIVVIEANACGTPGVGWNVPGLRDSIVDGKTGYLVPFGDVQQLGRKISMILRNDDSMGLMGSSTREWAKAHSWDRASEAFHRVIESIIG
jgi:glycosyltransferase involved in cell wall biosynthesis